MYIYQIVIIHSWLQFQYSAQKPYLSHTHAVFVALFLQNPTLMFVLLSWISTDSTVSIVIYWTVKLTSA